MHCNLDNKGLEFDWLMFDFDNTLVDFHEASLLAFNQTFDDYKLPLQDEYYSIYEGINAKIWSDFEQKLITADDIRKTRFTLFLKEVDLAQIDGLEFNTKYLSNIVKFTHIRPAVKELLEKFKKRYKLSIITNGLKEVQRLRLDKCGITHLFDSIIVSDEIGVAKPDKLFFDFAMQSIHSNFDKDKILVIGDSFRSDITGAKLYGLKSCYISKDEKSNANKADIVIEDVLELDALLSDHYKPVDCGWYDYLEIYSMRKTTVTIKFTKDGKTKNIITKIEDLHTKNKEEFALLSDGMKLRLDHIISIEPIEK